MAIYNAEKNIAKCLDDIKDVVDEIVIVIDDRTNDNTYEICKKYTDKIYFANTPLHLCEELRPTNLKHSKGDWLLVLDDDEFLDEEAKKEVRRIADSKTEEKGFFIKRKEIIYGKHLLTVPMLRLYRRDSVKYTCKMHEVPKIDGKIGKLKGYMLHYTTNDVTQHFNKLNKLSIIDAEEVYKKKKIGKMGIIFFGLIYSIKDFLTYYLYKGLIFKGLKGLIFSLNSGYYQIMLYSKYYELRYPKKHTKI
jgi:glycosyltransferase involved in cell wall biosynthesis